ncbi:MAG: DUF6599 family protein [Bacteroidales bacterium]
MIIRFFACFFFAISSFVSFSQNAESLKLTRSDLAGLEERRSNIYNESSLWGYINGGADLYIEYGFAELMAQDIVWETEPFKIDAYIMDSPESAFGIFSISRNDCKLSGEIGAWDCITPYQVQVAHGNLYLSVVAYNGTDRSMELAVEIAQNIVNKFKGASFELPSFFTNDDVMVNKSSVKLIKGQLAIQNSYVKMEESFNNIKDYKLWAVPFAKGDSKHNMLVASFSSEEDCNLVANRITDKFDFPVEKNNKQLHMFLDFNRRLNPDLVTQVNK